MTWVRAQRGFLVNLDHVERMNWVREVGKLGGFWRLWFRGPEEDSVDSEWSRSEDRLAEQLTADLVPAAAGATCYRVWVYEDLSTVDSERVAIAAWRVDDMGAQPIPAGDPPMTEERILIENPDGSVTEVGNATWPNIETACKSLLETVKEWAEQRKREEGE